MKERRTKLMGFLILLRNCRKMYLHSDPHGNTRASPDPLNGNEHKSSAAAGTPALPQSRLNSQRNSRLGASLSSSRLPSCWRYPGPYALPLGLAFSLVIRIHVRLFLEEILAVANPWIAQDCTGVFYVLFCFPGVFYPNLWSFIDVSALPLMYLSFRCDSYKSVTHRRIMIERPFFKARCGV